MAVGQAALNDTNVVKDGVAWKTIAAGPEYKRSNFHQWLWGRNRRAEWATPVEVPVLWLDTAFGGLKPYKEGGGNETRSLRLRSVNGNEYALRSVNKSRKEVIPDEFQNTFVQDIIQDQVSMAHPYGVLALAGMQEKAGIYHTRAKVVYLPEQAALDTFNDKYKNDLYLLEQRPDGDWSEANNLGNFEEYESTEDVIKNMLESNLYIADQRRFLKARLFDMLISDWDRHEDNWRWGVIQSGDYTKYIPVPRDRDQPFYIHNGILINFALGAARLNYMQQFNHKVKNIADLNWEMRHIDRFFTNSLSLDDWMSAAYNLQQALTDTVIAESVRRLPPEIFKISGNELIEKLKSRRDQLPAFAKEYYLFLSKEVAIPGSNEREYFEVKESDSGKTAVAVYRIDERGQTENEPYYRRTFIPGETKEIRLFGKEGHDEYNIKEQSKSIKINAFDTTPPYKYKWFQYDYKGFSPEFFYNNEDRFYVGLRFKATNYRWDKTSTFASQHIIGVRYSLSQNAFSAHWKALYPELIGKWDLLLGAEYDDIRWTNFYGLGNETTVIDKDVDFHRLRSHEWSANAGLSRLLGSKSRVTITGYYQQVKNINDTGRFVDKIFHFTRPDVYETNPYAGLHVAYSYTSLNDSIVPVKGFHFATSGTLANNFRQKEFFQVYEAHLRIYIPVTDHLSLAIRGGGATVVNDAVLNSGQQYEHALIGGPSSLRGYRRERFWGQTAYYNQNELRFITDLRTRIMNGKVGVFGFFDNGRVWMPGEKSNKIHIGYGPGIMIAPFNRISGSLTYSISEEIRLVQIRIDSRF